MPRLTKRCVETAGAGFHFDSEVKGFGLRVTDQGAKAFIVQYRPHPGGRRAPKRRYTIGPPDGPWTVDAARNEARRILGLVAARQDPAAERNVERLASSVAELCDEYLKQADAGAIISRFGRAKRASTLAIDRGRIERHIKPLIGGKRVADATSADVRKMLAAITRGATAGDVKTGKRGKARVRGGAGTAARVVQLLGGIMQFAVDDLKIIAVNPVRGVRLPKSEGKQRALNADEYKAFGAALAAAGPEINRQAVSAIRLLALTGWRRNEALELRWAALDGARQAVTLAETKTGKSIRPIGKAALEVIDSQPRHAGKPWVFPATSGKGHYIGLRRPFMAICKAAGLEHVTPHTLRHSLATVANEIGYAEATIAALIGHKARTMTAKYVHVVDDPLRKAADAVAAEIAARMGAKRRSEVVSFPRAAR